MELSDEGVLTFIPVCTVYASFLNLATIPLLTYRIREIVFDGCLLLTEYSMKVGVHNFPLYLKFLLSFSAPAF